ncbi:MAG TPA: hypothetical protein VHB53_07355 [Solirubrobacterales bacterium]|nr:hypothetical protein [Solirubrobacterales bacterium]
MQDVSRFQGLSRFEPRQGRAVAVALGVLLAVVALLVATGPAGAAAPATRTPKACPNFRVLHNDRIGPAVFPAGSYTITLEDESLTCKSGGELFARFLEDFDGILPTPWKVAPEASGKSSFTRGALPGFSVELIGKGGEGGGTNPDLGTLCRNTFTVNSNTVIRPLRFTKGKFLIYLPAGSGITCNRAAVLFTRFLGAGGTLPPPWKLIGQTATFYKPANPTRSAFRIEPLEGSGRR